MSDEPETELRPTLSAAEVEALTALNEAIQYGAKEAARAGALTKKAMGFREAHGPVGSIAEANAVLDALAWSSDPADAETLPYPDYPEPTPQERAYAWGMVAVAGALAAVATAVAVTVWITHRMDESKMGARSTVTQTVQPSPDDHVVAAPVTPPAAAVAPPVDDDAYVAASFSPSSMKGYYGTAGTDEQARSIAITECKTGGAQDCMVGESTFHGCVSVVFNSTGAFSGATGPDPQAAKDAANAKWYQNHTVQGWVTAPVCSK